MCVRRGYTALLPLLFATLLAWSVRPVRSAAQLIDLTKFADSTVGLSSSKWAGPRVPHPPPVPRPVAAQRLDSSWWPVSVSAGPEVAPARIARVLAAAETTFATLNATGMLTSFGDAGQGGTPGRDLYVLASTPASASASLDASGNFSALDGARAYGVLDARLPDDRVLACTAQALLDAQLLELDPAEADSVRTSSAAYFAQLISGQTCDDAVADLAANPFSLSASNGAAWLAQLGHRQDRNRGRFVFDMWQFARQRTWEGHDLRASPDLMEVIAKSLELEHDEFPLVASELSQGLARAFPATVRTLTWSALPFFSDKREPGLGVLGSKHVRVELGQARPGARLKAWARGEAGGSYVLSALRLDARGEVLARLELAPRRDPNSQLSIELDADTRSVLISVTRYADEPVPDPDRFSVLDLRPVQLILDSGDAEH